jgi:BirA family transcriptional regulator, biotin operon repressor / biotin---[acetyl-CoA-carboxylase] ligase
MSDALPAFFSPLHFETVDSTNEEAKRRALAGAPEGLLIWADRQTAGRGRQGRQWHSPPGNLPMSILLRPDRVAAETAQLSFAAALAVGEAVAPLLPDPASLRYKWPNDVLVDGAKLAGILLESSSSGGAVAYLVVGIGINIAAAPTKTETPATSLAALGAGKISSREMMACVAGRFLDWYMIWKDEGFAPLREAWLKRAHGLGSEIRVRHARTELRGRFVDLDPDGALVLETERGREHITAGAVFPAA